MRPWRLKIPRNSGSGTSSKHISSMRTREFHLSRDLLFREHTFEIDKSPIYSLTKSIPPEKDMRPKALDAVHIDTQALACAAADAVSNTSVPRVKWFAAGSWNTVYLISFDDGTEVVARIPYIHGRTPSSHPLSSKISSIVATMTFARFCCGIPCPRVLAWNSSESNPVGAPYILMEKVEGIVPWEVHPTLRLTMLAELAKYHARFAQPLPFSRIGSIYFARSKSLHREGRGARDLADPALYTVGPLTQGPGGYNHFAGLTSSYPATSLRQLWFDYVAAERTAAIRKWGTDRSTVIAQEDNESWIDRDRFRHPDLWESSLTMGDFLDAAAALEDVISLCPMPTDDRLFAPSLVIGDYACRNIRIDNLESMQVTSFIDWDDMAVMPFFLNTRLLEEISGCDGAPLEWQERHGAAYGIADYQGPVDPNSDFYHMEMTDQGYRTFYKEQLRGYDARFYGDLFRICGDLRLLHSIVTNGYGRWLIWVSWLRDRAREYAMAGLRA
ncbi:hypothetical protein B0H21DRAFT_742313 [Amylocystis lapponica]|nr:hypothetical protein B0H21DRAFT_742313 [Amylocystis lapponica]